MKVEDSYTKGEKQVAFVLGVTCEIARKVIKIKEEYKERLRTG